MHTNILRIWHGYTRPQHADAYMQLLQGTIFPAIHARQIPGFLHIELLRGDEADGLVPFITLMKFANMEAVQAFAGADYTTAVVPAAAQALLARYDQRVQHYAIIESQPA